MTKNEWSEIKYGGCYKNYMNGLITATISYATTGEKGYIARVGNATLKQRFNNITDAQISLDKLIEKRCINYINNI